MIELEEIMRQEEDSLDEARNIVDLQIFKKTDVIGITTTAAAKLKPMLNELGPKIGDHKQLRPNPAVFNLCRKFNFDVSLFERMIRNGLSCYTLNVQHRMRPEFASLIAPTIYSDLRNDISTNNRPDIKGVGHNLYFISHNHLEEQLIQSTSHVNYFEATYAVSLARYLHLQGYSQEEITILATYSGQVQKIKKIINGTLSNVRISTVDDFQGEENKIIILSLVRSNEEKSIGFLKTENRVCVALSRARDGLYIIGNMNFLAENAGIWMKIKETLLKQNGLGDALPIFCENHPTTVRQVKDHSVLDAIPEGGCKLMCKAKLECGHVCEYHCHPRDQSHINFYKCQSVCERKICERNHPCPVICGEKCEPCLVPVQHQLACGHLKEDACSSGLEKLMNECQLLVYHQLACGHIKTAACCSDVKELTNKCKLLVDHRLACGHIKTAACCSDVEELMNECQSLVDHQLACGHIKTAACSSDVEELLLSCLVPIENKLNCGHRKTATCSDKNKLVCSVKLPVSFPCGHDYYRLCSDSEEKVLKAGCNKICGKTLPCTHGCNEKCNNYRIHCCTKICKVKTIILLDCGHPLEVSCNTVYPENRKIFFMKSTFCHTEVEKTLICGHKKLMKCFEPVDKESCHEIVTRMLPCGRETVTECFRALSTLTCYAHQCSKLLSCSHPCNQLCGKPCSCGIQKEKVLPLCGHRVKYICSSEKSIKCKKPCERLLKCGHKCTSTCGRPCDRQCEVIVQSTVTPSCGHGQVSAPCFISSTGCVTCTTYYEMFINVIYNSLISNLDVFWWLVISLGERHSHWIGYKPCVSSY